jgi:pSer/pThr/pTyr-binding forkhead associated (FHA) protein/S1-C subfamily serine protease
VSEGGKQAASYSNREDIMEAKTETRVERIILRHLSGSKTSEEQKFDLAQFPEITIGRHPSCVIRFDENLDDMVSGKHAKITYNADNPTAFTLTDPGSRNGTFVNKHRVTNPVTLVPGDVLQFGAGGPQLEFDCEPHPEGMIKRTRTASSGSLSISDSHTIPPTRSGNMSAPLSDSFTGSLPSGGGDRAAKVSIGKETLERVVTAKQSETRRQMLYGVAALAVVLAALAWKFWPEPAKKCGEGGRCNPADIAQRFSKATVKINAAWKLMSPSGGLVYHQYLANRKENGEPLLPGGPNFLPCYVQLNDGTIEPYLTYNGNSSSIAIGGSHSGTGFVVTSSGFILTNRHVGATWRTEYDFPESATAPGLLYGADKRTLLRLGGRYASKWIPAETRQELRDFKGSNDVLEVLFPGNTSPVRANLERWSETHDVALIKINMPEAATQVELFDNYDTIKEGEPVTVLGYPAVTAPVFGLIRSQESAMRGDQYREIPRITVTPGSIGAILRSSEGREKTISTGGDVYQMTINATGPGNSGGPVFDDTGRVIAIYFASRRLDTTRVTLAVPIRYGKELMSLTK